MAPKSKVGVHKVDPKTGVKVEPTTKAVPPPPGKKQSHAGHPHGGQDQPKPKKPKVYPAS